MANGAGSPCGACKFLRRKCAADCIFAPYFCSEQGPARFAAIHKVFGASNVSKLLLHVPVPDRCEAVVTIAYEAQARIRDPVYGCVAHIFALQQQVWYRFPSPSTASCCMTVKVTFAPELSFLFPPPIWGGRRGGSSQVGTDPVFQPNQLLSFMDFVILLIVPF